MLLKLLLFTDTNHMHTQKLSVTAVAPVVNTAPTVSTVSHDVVVSSVVREAEHLVTTETKAEKQGRLGATTCLLYTSPSPRDRTRSRMPSSA